MFTTREAARFRNPEKCGLQTLAGRWTPDYYQSRESGTHWGKLSTEGAISIVPITRKLDRTAFAECLRGGWDVEATSKSRHNTRDVT